ncbi:MAG: hypothetical protein Q8O89_00750 [Nanoarchaeota archaeon]|nr:hypothetical protein [Nanoarchaeota archaeon]
MKPFIDIDSFIGLLNYAHLTGKSPEAATVKVEGKDFTAFLIMKTEQDYKQNFTIEFLLKFEHKKRDEKDEIFQREFKIEHHPKEKSRHTEPHVQLYIHGPGKSDKVGELWITLPLETEEEYSDCIKGFFYILEEIIGKCERNLEKQMLNLTEIKKLAEQKKFLKSKIALSLKSKGIEYQNPDGEKIILSPKNVNEILSKDQSLLSFFEAKQ